MSIVISISSSPTTVETVFGSFGAELSGGGVTISALAISWACRFRFKDLDFPIIIRVSTAVCYAIRKELAGASDKAGSKGEENLPRQKS